MKYKVKFLKRTEVPYNTYEVGDVAILTDWYMRETPPTRRSWAGDDKIVVCYGHGCFSGPLFWDIDIEKIE